tara:strand:- start:138 stop:608 length:471 start_codon:yes stop_codon:yes gene_type:complete
MSPGIDWMLTVTALRSSNRSLSTEQNTVAHDSTSSSCESATDGIDGALIDCSADAMASSSSSSAPDCANDDDDDVNDDDGWRERDCWLPDLRLFLQRNGSIINVVVVVAVRLDHHASLFPKEKTTRDREDDVNEEEHIIDAIISTNNRSSRNRRFY